MKASKENNNVCMAVYTTTFSDCNEYVLLPAGVIPRRKALKALLRAVAHVELSMSDEPGMSIYLIETQRTKFYMERDPEELAYRLDAEELPDLRIRPTGWGFSVAEPV